MRACVKRDRRRLISSEQLQRETSDQQQQQQQGELNAHLSATNANYSI